MSETPASDADHQETGIYCDIRIKGHLDDRWADWFEGMALNHESDGTTTLRGSLPDQAALHGVFSAIRDLGTPIISIRCGSPE